jgi:hypothetical protein
VREQSGPGIDLYWLPVGAGGHSVRWNGRVFEAVVARLERRSRCDLYHTALVVYVPAGRFVLEQGPLQRGERSSRGVVSVGAVGFRWAARFPVFRYELRCSLDGLIDDVTEAVESPQRLTSDAALAQRVLELAPSVPAATWGRDELRAGEMWNSNSVVSWLLARAGIAAQRIRPPSGGRAPGWRAGLVVADRGGASRARARSGTTV